jgi:hypothetical protein
MSLESHNEAIRIEDALKSIYNCHRLGFGGNVDADLIEINPIQSYKIGLSPIYANANDQKRNVIDGFIQDLYEYENTTIEKIGIPVVEALTIEFENLIKCEN